MAWHRAKNDNYLVNDEITPRKDSNNELFFEIRNNF